MIASALIATTLASAAPAAPVAPAAQMAPMAPSAPSAAKAPTAGMAEGKMDCCKDGCACCGKDKAGKAATAPARAH